jgi:hypothetical protein
MLLLHCVQKVDALNHAKDMRCLVNPDLLRVIRQVLAQSVRTLKNVKVEFVESHFPKERLLEFLQLTFEVRLNELLVHDRA